MAGVSERVSVLEERVANHIKFFWGAVIALGVWLAWVSVMLYQTHASVGTIAQSQGNAPAQVAAALLKKPAPTADQAASNLAAVSAVLRSAAPTKAKPNSGALKAVASGLISAQTSYPQLPQVWTTTAEFINYKSDAALAGGLKSFGPIHGIDCRNGGGITFENGVITFKNCRLSLDHLIYAHGVPVFFIHCIVEYGGGELPPDPLFFRDCLFRFHVNQVPPPSGARTMTLLAQAENILDVKVLPVATHS